MTDNEINQIIAARERVTNRRDEQIDWVAVDHFDAVLAQVPAGTRPDVDLLLGRPAELPERVEYQMKPYHERATVHIPACPTCEMPGFDVTLEELQDAQGVIACEHCDTLISPEYGPQPAPSDYRIANRPDNPNWHGVAAWFDEAAGLRPSTDTAAATERVAELAQAKQDEFLTHIADQYADALDWHRMCGDLGI